MRLLRSLRRLAGLAIVALAALAPAPALAHGGDGTTLFTETNGAANAIQAFAQARDGSLVPGPSPLLAA